MKGPRKLFIFLDLGWSVIMLRSHPAMLLVSVLVGSRGANVVLPCMTPNYTLAITPQLASVEPSCSWNHYNDHVARAGLTWTDGVSVRVATEVGGSADIIDSELHAELTSPLTTALTIVDMLRLSLGNEAYASRTEPVTVDMIGWAFHWTDRAEVHGTSNTIETSQWDTELQRQTRLYWGSQIGGALRRMLPNVESVVIRGFGPEAPLVARTPLRDDGWLSLELYPGVYDHLSEPAPTLTLLENSGMHDDLWPSDGGCISDKGMRGLGSRNPHGGMQKRVCASTTCARASVAPQASSICSTPPSCVTKRRRAIWTAWASAVCGERR